MEKTIGWRFGCVFSGDAAAVHAELELLDKFGIKEREKVEYLLKHSDDFPAIWANLPTDRDDALFELQVHTLHMIETSLEITVKPHKTKEETYTVRARPKNPNGPGYISIDSITESDDRDMYLEGIMRRLAGLQRELSDTREYFQTRGYKYPANYIELERKLKKAM